MSRGGRRRGRWWHADERCAGVALADLARAGVGHLADLRRGPAFELLPARLGESVQPPAGGVLQEALWYLTAHAAARLGEPETAARAAVALRDARAEHAGAASGMLTLGPVERYLAGAEACAAADQ